MSNTYSMKILITGANGLLGQKLVRQLLKRGIDFCATSLGANRNPDCPDSHYKALDITNSLEVNEVVLSYCPTHVIHTAAMTNVDACELDPDTCERINFQGTRYLFEACKLIEAHFQLLSTDFVFDGLKGNYRENDEVNPLSIYAASKVRSEALLQRDAYTNWSIVRTIIVYGTANNLSRSNLIEWAKSSLKKQEPMRVVNDQFRAPTWADDLAWGCIRICELSRQGIYHLSGPETLSIFEIVQKIAAHFGYGTGQLTEVSSTTLNQPAKRPPKTGFDLSKARKELGYVPKNLIETLDLA